jgi:hypothetical protein
MENERPRLFKLVEGLKAVDPAALEKYRREMAEKGIPDIIRDVERRRMLAAQSRQRRLEKPSPKKSALPEKPEPPKED